MNLDATIIVAVIGLIGIIYTTKTNSLIALNKQLMEMLEDNQEEIKALKVQHASESERLEKKITILTQENTSLREQVSKLNNLLLKQGISL